MNDQATVGYDPMDMNNYKIEKLPKMQKSGFERLLQRLGGPLAVAVFALIYWVGDFSFLASIAPETLTGAAAKRFAELGEASFTRINYAMLAIFAASIILWISEAIPNYLTSLIVILAIVLTGVTTDKTAYAQPVSYTHLTLPTNSA